MEKREQSQLVEPIIMIGMKNTGDKSQKVELFKNGKPDCVTEARIVDNLEVQDYDSLMEHLKNNQYGIGKIFHKTQGDYEGQQKEAVYLHKDGKIHQYIPSLYLNPFQFQASIVDISVKEWELNSQNGLHTTIQPQNYLELVFLPTSETEKG